MTPARTQGLPVLGFRTAGLCGHDTVRSGVRNSLSKPPARLTKVVFDFAAALIGLIILTPVLAVVAMLVKLDGGPALYGHPRIGFGGRTFRCLKFRSMVTDSEAALRRVLATDPTAAAEWAETHKLGQDPRVTAVGRVLRMTSLDELPQLFNVLRLEMSLVGPRPIVEAEVPRYGADIAYYYYDAAGPNRSLAGKRPHGNLVRTTRTARYMVRPELVALARRNDYGQDGPSGA